MGLYSYYFEIIKMESGRRTMGKYLILMILVIMLIRVSHAAMEVATTFYLLFIVFSPFFLPQK